jgi:hypothetical protein
VPGGVAKTVIQTKEPELKNAFDEWIARVVCFAFSISPQPFVNQMNRATSETQKEAAEEEGLLPILSWIKRLCDHIVQNLLGSGDVEFVWRHEPVIDPTIQRENLVAYVNAGMMTRRRAAEIMGETLPSDPMADVPTVMTGQGVVRLGGNATANDVGKIGDEVTLVHKYSPDQPRDGNGRWTLMLAGEVINICVASGVSIFTDDYGNKSYSVSYECRDGYMIKFTGFGSDFRGFIIDPRG